MEESKVDKRHGEARFFGFYVDQKQHEKVEHNKGSIHHRGPEGRVKLITSDSHQNSIVVDAFRLRKPFFRGSRSSNYYRLAGVKENP